MKSEKACSKLGGREQRGGGCGL